MSPDEAAFLLAICAAPDDDTPRLVFADWLEEHGQPHRAEFIRLQCELATLTTDSPRRREIAFRCREMIDSEGEQLCPGPLSHSLPFNRFCRGFVEAIELDADSLGEATAAALKVRPIRRARVAMLRGDIGRLQRIPADNSLIALDLTGNDLSTDAVRSLARFKRFPGLQELSLMFNRLDDGAVDLLCHWQFFRRLSRLKLGANPFTDDAREYLRNHLGDRVTFECERDDDHLYAIQGDYFSTGFGNDYQQLLIGERRDGTWLVTFDHAGNVIRTEIHKHLDWAAKEFNDRLREQLGFRPATIRVKRFKFADGVGIEGFTPTMVEDFDDPDSDEIEDTRDWLHGWLDQGQFRWTWVGDDYWLNREGEVTDT